MKKICLLITAAAMIFAACHCDNHCPKPPFKAPAPKVPYGNSSFIPVDSANKMLLSYLNSVNYQQNDTDLDCLTVDADTMRAYLANPNVKKIKLMLAHTLEYINAGGGNQNCGYQTGALTIIMACYDSANNYVYYQAPGSATNMVLDHAMPCPSNCAHGGSAASNILVQQPQPPGRK
jgi:hypothetical protein